MDPKLFGTEGFIQPVADYFYLIDRDYPEKGSLKLVGDRYKLSAEMRTLLYRGIASTVKSTRRTNRLIRYPSAPLIIDGYNVLFTLMNYRLGRFVFISTDSLCRDAGLSFGKILSENVFDESIELLAGWLQSYLHLEVIIYLDIPVSNSRNHGKVLLSRLAAHPLLNLELTESADESILQHTNGTIATSDSALIDKSGLPIIDIPLTIISQKYNASIFNLKERLTKILHS
jgi:hypothetical protein